MRDADGFVWQPEHHGYRCTCGQCPGIDICHWDHVLSCYGPLTEVRVQS